ncbi:MAG TPA: DUF2933 domain-containing protein [Micropepsaceae bacterium]|nr:DUF2933 domain-containing protein [Micropepsaceae bacterium]
MQRSGNRNWGIACLYAAGFGIAAVLLVQPWVRLPAILPYLVFLAFPLMHFIMHGRRGDSHSHEPAEETESPDSLVL